MHTGHDDDELPEQSLCAVRLSRLSAPLVPPIADVAAKQKREQDAIASAAAGAGDSKSNDASAAASPRAAASPKA